MLGCGPWNSEGTELANDGIQSGCRMEVVYEGLQVRWRWERTGVGPGLGG